MMMLMLRHIIAHLQDALARVILFILGLVAIFALLFWLLPEYLHWLFWRIVTP